MDGMAAMALAFAAGAVLGGAGAYLIFTLSRRRRDMAGIESELSRIDGDIRKMDRNFRLFLEDCKTAASQAQAGTERAASALEALSMDAHAKLSVQSDTLERVDTALKSLSEGVPERFDVLDRAHREMGADINRILDRVKNSV